MLYSRCHQTPLATRSLLQLRRVSTTTSASFLTPIPPPPNNNQSHTQAKRHPVNMVRSSKSVPKSLDSRKLTDEFFLMDQDTQTSATPSDEVEKVFPQRGPLSLHRLVERASFICSHCSLIKRSKLVGYAEDRKDEPLCNGCYGKLLSTSERQGEAPL